MTLIEAAQKLRSFPRKDTIFAERIDGKWLPESLAVILPPLDSHSTRRVIDGRLFEYVLEVYLAWELVDDWAAAKGQDALSGEESLFIVTYYGEHDDVPDLD